DVAKIVCIELRVFADLSREKAFSKGTEWNEPDAQFLKGWDHLRFRLSPPKRILALECRHRLNCMCAADGLHCRFRKAEVLHLTLLNQVLHRSGDLFDGYLRIDTVLIEKIDAIGLEPLQ